MGEPYTPHLYDFGIWGRVPEPKNQLLLFLEAPGYLEKIKKINGTFREYYLFKSQNFGNPKLENVGKDGNRNMMKIHLRISCKSCI